MYRAIAIYGKGGSGKSSIATALSAYYAIKGYKVLHIGCDPKSDSSRLLYDKGKIKTVIGVISKTSEFDLSNILMKGRHNIFCIETGGPEPGVGCAGRGITRTFEILREYDFSLKRFNVVIFDVLGDVVCGGFAVPLKVGYAQYVAIVVSGTSMSLFAANNISKAIKRFSRNGVRLAGLIANYHTGNVNRERVEEFARLLNTKVLVHIPHDPMFQEAEEHRINIYEYAPDSEGAKAIEELGEKLLKIDDPPIPSPLSQEAFERFLWKNPLRKRK